MKNGFRLNYRKPFNYLSVKFQFKLHDATLA